MSNDGYIVPVNDYKLYDYAEDHGLHIRIIRRGTMITMDLQLNRLNINLDENNKITGVDRG